jgi:type I restriction enzyme S subunit
MTDEFGSTNVQGRKELPAGWCWVKLGDVCKVVGGSTPDTGESAYWGNDFVWVTPADLGKLSGVFIHDTSRKITSEGFLNCGTELLPVGAVIMSSRAPIGHLAIAGMPLCTNQGCKSFVPSGEVDSLFLYWGLKKAVPDIQALGSGATFAEVSKSTLQQFKIPLPPLPEQQRIATLLKEQMAAVDKARAAAEERLAAIKALPAAFLRQVFPQQDQPIPDGWRWVRLGDVCDVVGGSTPDTGNQAYWNGDITWVTPTDLGKLSDISINSTSRTITRSGLQNCGTRLIPIGSVVMSSRAPIGHLGIASDSLCTNQGCKSFVPGVDVDSVFLYWSLKRLVPDIQALGSGATFTEVSKSILCQFEIPLPPLTEQQRIAALLKEQMTVVEKARIAAEAELETINALPTSLLRRAFNGEL